MEELPTLRHGPKRPHKKVRTGCGPCKRRKVKCDEQRPKCTQCTRQDTQCDITSNYQMEPPAPSPSFSEVRVDESMILNMLDLELIHHWTSSTYDSLTSSPLLRTFWLRNAVKVGFRCGFVMRTILALSAVHLGTLNPERGDALLQHALVHHNLAALRAHESICHGSDTEDVETYENHFLFSVLMMFFIISQTDNPQDAFFGRTGRTKSDKLDWMVFFRGSRYFALASESLHSSSSLTHPIINHMMEMYYYREKVSKRPHFPILLDRVNRIGNDRPSSEREVYMHAAQELDTTFAVLSEFEETRDMLHAFFWISNVSDHRGDLIALLQGPTPPQEALAIFTCFCMLPQRLSARWWSDRWVEGLKNGKFDFLDEEHRTWVVEPPAWDA
ncbi:Putative zn(2)Cys(6) fungal-type DNA-binding domain, fungal transcription factor [Colletotrichum destructivum]|uniref:Zn(2)Cys(6) fungal-type DNA-binding domain, fungal transcription factor n=1 Tax=Colletotrichum destructivum TaxID=34406 RepID=A0AAX4IR69_9PEZI|nr:Putative zn(2)Cys(6) fungal-type DNA-binding domain, fungal transcription factor [Colletotrichum destructivum]